MACLECRSHAEIGKVCVNCVQALKSRITELEAEVADLHGELEALAAPPPDPDAGTDPVDPVVDSP